MADGFVLDGDDRAEMRRMVLRVMDEAGGEVPAESLPGLLRARGCALGADVLEDLALEALTSLAWSGAVEKCLGGWRRT